MKLWRTIDNYHRSHQGEFEWAKVGGKTIAPDWDSDPEIECGKGLHGIAADDERMFNYLNINPGNIIQLVEAENVVLSAEEDKYRFQSAITLEEYLIPKGGIPYLFNRLPMDTQIDAGLRWRSVTSEMMREVFLTLKGYPLYSAGLIWKGINDKLRIDAFEKLEGWSLIFAGKRWKGITDEMRKKAFLRLDKKYIKRARINWKIKEDF